MIIKADIKEEALNSREEALRENPFAGLFPSLKEAAAHKTLEKSLKRDMLKNSTMNQMLDEVVEKEQCEVPLIINEQDLVGVSLSKQGPEVSNMKVETVVAAEEIGKPDISFPHEPGAGGADSSQSKIKKTMEKATLLKLMSSEIRLKYAIKALDDTEVSTLNWDKLERISARLAEHWDSYEDSFIAYQKLFNQYSAAADKHFFTLLEAFMAVIQHARLLLDISLSGGNVKHKLLLKFSLKIKKVQLDKVEMEMYWCGEVPLINVKQDLKRVALAKPGLELKQDSQPNVLQGKGPKVFDMKAEAETKMDMMQHALEENGQLKEERMSKEEMDLEADKLLAPEWMESRSKAEKLENCAEAAEQSEFKELMLRQHNLNTKKVEMKLMHVLKAEAVQVRNTKQKLTKEELMELCKQDLVEVSLTKKVEMKLMHVLKAEVVRVRNLKQKLMKEEVLKYCKKYLKVEQCEKEGREALQLLVDKQAAAAG